MYCHGVQIKSAFVVSIFSMPQHWVHTATVSCSSPMTWTTIEASPRGAPSSLGNREIRFQRYIRVKNIFKLQHLVQVLTLFIWNNWIFKQCILYQMIKNDYCQWGGFVQPDKQGFLSIALLILIFPPQWSGNHYETVWHQEDRLCTPGLLQKQINFSSWIGWWKSSSAGLSIAMVTEDGISHGNSIYIHTEAISLSKLGLFLVAMCIIH